ncbi:MAG: hypothetical protein IH960_10275, partial [Chloroflexi bacterium]|nr:hypothetical protein [Chloroflexota bacterium]
VNWSAPKDVAAPEVWSAPEVVAESAAESDADVQPKTMSNASPMNIPATTLNHVRVGESADDIDVPCNSFYGFDALAYGDQAEEVLTRWITNNGMFCEGDVTIQTTRFLPMR